MGKLEMLIRLVFVLMLGNRMPGFVSEEVIEDIRFERQTL